MSRKAGRAFIGAFVLGALALLLTAVAVIGSGRLFSTPLRFVIFFDSSLKGLSSGSMVVFRGVPVGRVTAIRLSGDADTLELFLPVYVEIDTSVMQDLKNIGSIPRVDASYMQEMLRHGLRARLNNQSLLTGQLLIELDFLDDAHLEDAFMPRPVHDSLLVIPSVASQFDEAWHRLSELPLDELVKRLNSILGKIDTALASQAVRDLPVNLNSAVLEARSVLGLMNTVAGAVDQQTPEMLADSRRLVDTYIALAGQFERSLENIRGVVGPNTLAVLELTRALREVGETAKAARGLAVMLERNPESLFMGKGADRR